MNRIRYVFPILFVVLVGCIYPPASLVQYQAAEGPEVSQRETILSELKANAARAPGAVPGSVGVLTFDETGDRGLGLAATEFFTSNLGLFEQFTLIDMSYAAVLSEEFYSYSLDRKRTMLKAEQLITGKVAFDGDAISISSHVVKERAKPLGDLRGGEKDFFRLVADLNIKFLENTGIAVSPAIANEMYRVPTEDLEAYVLYAKGRKHERLGEYEAALKAYAQAAKRDPEFKEVKASSERVQRKAEIQRQAQEAREKQAEPEKKREEPVEPPVRTALPEPSPTLPTVEEQHVPPVGGNSKVIIEIPIPEE